MKLIKKYLERRKLKKAFRRTERDLENEGIYLYNILEKNPEKYGNIEIDTKRNNKGERV
jgi:hypothetical protein